MGPGNSAWLQNFSQSVSAFGMVTEMLGMNADALFRVSSGLLHFFERVGAAIFELSSFISAQPPVDANGACDNAFCV